jgi:hypothetical protein
MLLFQLDKILLAFYCSRFMVTKNSLDISIAEPHPFDAARALERENFIRILPQFLFFGLQ